MEHKEKVKWNKQKKIKEEGIVLFVCLGVACVVYVCYVWQGVLYKLCVCVCCVCVSGCRVCVLRVYLGVVCVSGCFVWNVCVFVLRVCLDVVCVIYVYVSVTCVLRVRMCLGVVYEMYVLISVVCMCVGRGRCTCARVRVWQNRTSSYIPLEERKAPF